MSYIQQTRRDIVEMVERSGLAVVHLNTLLQAFPDTDPLTRLALAFGGHRDPTSPEK